MQGAGQVARQLHRSSSSDNIRALGKQQDEEQRKAQRAARLNQVRSWRSPPAANPVAQPAIVPVGGGGAPRAPAPVSRGMLDRIGSAFGTIGHYAGAPLHFWAYVSDSRPYTWAATAFSAIGTVLSVVSTPVRWVATSTWWVTKTIVPIAWDYCTPMGWIGLSSKRIADTAESAASVAKTSAKVGGGTLGMLGIIGTCYYFGSTAKSIISSVWDYIFQPTLGVVGWAGGGVANRVAETAKEGIESFAKDALYEVLPADVQKVADTSGVVNAVSASLWKGVKDTAWGLYKEARDQAVEEANKLKEDVKVYATAKFTEVDTFLNNLTFRDVMGYGTSAVDWSLHRVVDLAGAAWDNSSWQGIAVVSAYIGYKTFRAFGPKFINHAMDYYFKAAKDRIGRIDLGEEYNIPVITPIMRALKKIKGAIFPPIPKPRPLFKGTLQRRIEHYIQMQENASKNGGDLQHLALEGLPGTGKTLTANYIADRLGFDIIRASGPKLCALINKKKDHIQEWQRIMNRAKNSHWPTMIFIDEADAFLGDRDGPTEISEGKLELLNQFLSDLGTSGNKVCIVVATNRYNKLDPAVRSRLEMKIRVPLPDLDTRRSIIAQEVFRKFRPGDAERNEKTGCLNWNGIDRIARVTRQLSGRSLEQMIKHLHGLKACQADGKLTRAIVEKQVRKFVRKARDDMGAERSWRIVEMADDAWHYWLPEVQRQFRMYRHVAQALVRGMGRLAKEHTIEFLRDPQGHVVRTVKAVWEYVSEKLEAFSGYAKEKGVEWKEKVVKANDDFQKLIGRKPKTRWEKLLDWFHARAVEEKKEKQAPVHMEGWADNVDAPEGYRSAPAD